MENCVNRESYSMYLSISVWEKNREKKNKIYSTKMNMNEIVIWLKVLAVTCKIKIKIDFLW